MLSARTPAPTATALFAGGCFWGVESVFEHVRGVRAVTSGYVGAGAAVETVQVEYDPSRVTYRQLLEIFFLVAHDPTTRDRQGPDVGAQYRAIVFYGTEAERDQARGYLAELSRARRFAAPIVTEVRPRAPFVLAEPFHQDYAARHPKEPYIVWNDEPKLARLRSEFPSLYRQAGGP
jgi:peptide-methionine (S)-S-oxide reductase